MRFAADNLALLLSSSWFRDAWALCGMNPSSEARASIQRECRSIVESIVAGCSVYWDAEFSEQRGLHTKARLLKAFDVARFQASDEAVCRRYLDAKDTSDKNAVDASLIPTLCSLYVDEYSHRQGVPAESKRIAKTIQEAISNVDDERAICEAAKHPTSKWDKWLINLTPDLPLLTTDVALELARAAGSTDRLLTILKINLRESELAELDTWLRSTAASLAGVQLQRIF